MVTFGQVLADFRLTTRGTASSSVGQDIDAVDRMHVNRGYDELRDLVEWPGLKARVAVTLAPGQRYFDFPSALDPDRLHGIWQEWGGEWRRIDAGITPDLFSSFNSERDERSSPVTRQDRVWIGERTQIEVWPIPSIETPLLLEGTRPLPRLVDDADPVLLDRNATVLMAAAAATALKDPEKAAQLTQQAAAAARKVIEKSRPPSGGPGSGRRLMPGDDSDRRPVGGTISIRVSG